MTEEYRSKRLLKLYFLMKKRCFDFILACTGIFICLPAMLIIAIILRSNNKNSIFYLQERLGKNGKIFRIIKFQTMKKEKVISPFCRFLRLTAMDELPQLINIVKGDMSFVGPRPLIREEMQELRDKHFYEERMKILPGLTGITQVLLYKDAPPEEKCIYDIWYNNNRTFILDVELLLVSCLITFLGRWEIDVDKIYILNKLKKKIDLKVKVKEENG